MLPSVLATRAAEAGIALVIGGRELIDELEPLWLSLFDHHRDGGGAGLPMIDRALSWPRRRRVYSQLLEAPEAAVVVARRDAMPIGYCLVHVHHGADDTWPTGELIGEVESLAVVAAERGRGLGTLLLDAGEAHLAAQGAHDVIIGVLAGNDSAVEFYRRRGMTPALVKMLRLRPEGFSTSSIDIQHAMLVPILATDPPIVGPFAVLLDRESSSPYRNYAAPRTGDTPTGEEIAALVWMFRSRGLQPRLEYVELDPSLTTALLAADFTIAQRIPLLSLGTLVAPPPVPGITANAATPDDLVGAATIMALAYGDEDPIEQGAARLGRTIAAGGGVSIARDTASGTIVGAGLHTAPVDGLVEIAAVGTHPDFRRRGVATHVGADLARQAIAIGAHPFLQAEGEAEARIYERIGFERCGSMIFAEAPA